LVVQNFPTCFIGVKNSITGMLPEGDLHVGQKVGENPFAGLWSPSNIWASEREAMIVEKSLSPLMRELIAVASRSSQFL
jgi:hypothetical protein